MVGVKETDENGYSGYSASKDGTRPWIWRRDLGEARFLD